MQLTIIASLVIVTDQVLKAFVYDISKQLSVFVGLIITNCIVMGRAEAFAMQNAVTALRSSTASATGSATAHPDGRGLLARALRQRKGVRIHGPQAVVDRGRLVRAQRADGAGARRVLPDRMASSGSSAAGSPSRWRRISMLEHYLSLATKAVFVENMALAFFLGMCSFLAVSKKVETAIGLGIAVIFVLAVTTPLNQIIYTELLLQPGSLAWAGLGTSTSRSYRS